MKVQNFCKLLKLIDGDLCLFCSLFSFHSDCQKQPAQEKHFTTQEKHFKERMKTERKILKTNKINTGSDNGEQKDRHTGAIIK